MRRRRNTRRRLVLALRAEVTSLRADVDALVDAIVPAVGLTADRYALHEHVEAEVRALTALPGMTALGFAQAMKWGRA